MRTRCWGIFREHAHSPGRESDDTEILRLTGKALEAQGFDVAFKSPEDVPAADEGPPALVFLMCERVEVLARLQAMEARGVRMVNSPAAVLNTYREQMIARFAEAAVPFIESRVIATAEGHGWPGRAVWVKRADVHNTREGDVVLATTEDQYRAALAGLAGRDIPRAVLQPPVDGDLIKFYGIGTGGGRDGAPPWFRWFYHRNQKLANHPFDARALGALVRRAAGALGLEVYGGDVIVTATADIVLLDLNAWPSFALYRDEAAGAIAAHLALRCGRGRA